jgi:hypothetical protein
MHDDRTIDIVRQLNEIQEKLQHLDIHREILASAAEYQSAIMGLIFASILLKHRYINNKILPAIMKAKSVLILKDICIGRVSSEDIKRFLDLNADGNMMIELSIKQLDQLQEIRYDDDIAKSMLDRDIAWLKDDMQKFKSLCEFNLKLCCDFDKLYELSQVKI